MATVERDILRRVRFSPYRKGAGPVFRLTVWDTNYTDRQRQFCDEHAEALGAEVEARFGDQATR